MFLHLYYLPTRWKGLLLSLGMLLAVAGQATAQQLPILADTAAPQAAQADTAAALHRLFAAQRHGLLVRFAVANNGLFLFSAFLASNKQETGAQRFARGVDVTFIGVSIFNLTTAIIDARRYRPAREQALLAALVQGQPLPRRLRKRLAWYLKPEQNTPPPPKLKGK
ncbi:MAG: hypothetical protein ACRYFX_06325 [Janthinobacterium lividum]